MCKCLQLHFIIFTIANHIKQEQRQTIILKIREEAQKIEKEVNDCPCGTNCPGGATGLAGACKGGCTHDVEKTCACCLSGVATLLKLKMHELSLVDWDQEKGSLLDMTAEEEAAYETIADE